MDSFYKVDFMGAKKIVRKKPSSITERRQLLVDIFAARTGVELDLKNAGKYAGEVSDANSLMKYIRKKGVPYSFIGDNRSRGVMIPFAVNDIRRRLKVGSFRILDVGPGKGLYLKRFSTNPKIDVHSLSPSRIKVQGVNHHVGTIEKFPFSKLGSFDVVHANHSILYHSSNPIRNLETLLSLLAPKGKLFASVSPFVMGIDIPTLRERLQKGKKYSVVIENIHSLTPVDETKGIDTFPYYLIVERLK